MHYFETLCSYCRYVLIITSLIGNVVAFAQHSLSFYADSLYVEGIAHYAKGNYVLAIQDFERCEVMNDSIERNGAYYSNNAIEWCAYLQHLLGNDRIAVECSDFYMFEPVDQRRTISSDRIIYQAEIAYEVREWSKALEYFQEALDIEKEILGLNHYYCANTYYAMGVCADSLEQVSKAEYFYKSALAIWDSYGYLNRDRLQVNYSLGELYEKIGVDDSAHIYYKKCVELLDSVGLGVNEDLCNYFTSEARKFFNNQEWYKAKEFLEIGIPYYEKAELYEYMEHAYTWMYEINMRLNLMDEARSELNKAVRIRRDILNQKSETYSQDRYLQHLHNIAYLYKETGQIAEGIKLINEVIELKRNCGYKLDTSLRLAAQLYYRADSVQKAILYMEESALIRKDRFGVGSLEYADILSDLSIYYSMVHDTVHAIDLMKRAFRIKKDNNSVFPTDYLNLALLYYNSLDIEEAYLYTDSAFNLWKEHFNRNLGLMPSRARYALYSSIENRSFLDIRNLLQRGEVRSRKFADIGYDYCLFTKGLLLRYDTQALREDRAMPARDISWKDVQKALPQDAFAIEFLFGGESKNDRYFSRELCAIIVHPDFKEPLLLSFPDSCAVTSQLWNRIIAEAKIKEGDTIYFSPDGYLHVLPIEYTRLNDGRCMHDVYNMRRVSSTGELCSIPKEQYPKSAILFGGLNYDHNPRSGAYRTVHKEERNDRAVLDMLLENQRDTDRAKLEYLPMSRVEVDSIEYILDDSNVSATKYISEEGSEESFKSMSHNAPQILHIATHGYYIPVTDAEKMSQERLSSMTINPNSDEYNSIVDYSMDRTGLLLAGAQKRLKGEQIPEGIEDGILTANEISRLDLRGTDLVVLSACNTGMGDITSDGVAGLQRGFKLAGVKSILMSLWKVDDAATCMLMTQFYRNLLSGKSKHESLRDAQRYLRNYEQDGDHIFEDVKYWGGFVLLD